MNRQGQVLATALTRAEAEYSRLNGEYDNAYDEVQVTDANVRRTLRYPGYCPSEPGPRLFPLSRESQVDARAAHRAGITTPGPILPVLRELGIADERAFAA